MHHIFEKGKNDHTFVLLHGTGGNETDLMPLVKYIDPNANILGVRGDVIENGMVRFFERYGVGKYNLESLEREANKLYEFIVFASKKYGFDFNKVYLLGFSNGANIAIAMLHRFSMHIKGAYLLSPVFIERDRMFADQSSVDIIITASSNDPFATDEEVIELAEALDKSAKSVDLYKHNFGHTVNQVILDDLKDAYFKG